MLDPAAFSLLRVARQGATATLELHHGKANEIGSAVLAELELLARSLRDDPEVRTLISTSRRTTSRGTPIFVAGADVTERAGWTEARVLAHVAWQRDVLRALRDAPVFHVAVVGGVAFGWGTEFLLTADYRIAAPGASFALPETGLGIVPGACGTALLVEELGVAHTLRLGMTGEPVDPAEALRIGLVQEVAADLDAGLARAQALADRAATRSPTAVAAFKAAVRGGVGQSEAVRVEAEQAAYALCVGSGEAAIGRAHFDDVRAGRVPPWGPRTAG